jgi:threonylcarbamoyladenosine tRNA methylthiotransferase MtaB
MKVYLDSIGCRLNQSEIETMARQLLAAGHEIVSDANSADSIILNTCAVTKQATRDTRQKTRRFHRANPDAEIILTGCHATLSPDNLITLDGVKIVVPNSEKRQLVQHIDPKAILALPVYDREPIIREFMAGGMGNTRAFIKVQDGCKNKCTFCITTVARGDGVSRHMADIVTEIQALAQAGYQEAVLTGVHLGSYGHDFGNHAGLHELVRLILEHTDIPRLRLSSLEPWDISAEFFTLWQNPRLLPHLHMPLQAGCDRTLRRMARRTSQAAFRELTEFARAAIPNINLTSDIICGFPGETDADFAESLAYVAEIGFSRLHVFGYSARPGTAAATMPNHVPKVVKKERVQRMIALGKEMGLAFHQQYEGQTVNVLWEQVAGADENGLRWQGYTDNYIRVLGHGGAELVNRVTPTQLYGAHADGMEGAILEPVGV